MIISTRQSYCLKMWPKMVYMSGSALVYSSEIPESAILAIPTFCVPTFLNAYSREIPEIPALLKGPKSAGSQSHPEK